MNSCSGVLNSSDIFEQLILSRIRVRPVHDKINHPKRGIFLSLLEPPARWCRVTFCGSQHGRSGIYSCKHRRSGALSCKHRCRTTLLDNSTVAPNSFRANTAASDCFRASTAAENWCRISFGTRPCRLRRLPSARPAARARGSVGRCSFCFTRHPHK